MCCYIILGFTISTSDELNRKIIYNTNVSENINLINNYYICTMKIKTHTIVCSQRIKFNRSSGD